MTPDPLPYLDAYRIGWRLRYIRGDRRRRPRRMGRNRLNWVPFRRPWQCEVSYGRDCTCSAVRAFTRAGAMARMDRAHSRRYVRGDCPQPLTLWPYDRRRPSRPRAFIAPVGTTWGEPGWTEIGQPPAMTEWTEHGTNEAGPAGHEHDWQPYTDTTAHEVCGTWGCGVERKRVRSAVSDPDPSPGATRG